MAEFTEIVKQAHRMCGSYDDKCDTSCPLGSANNPDGLKLCQYIGFTDLESAKEIEKRVLVWAAEHPEPVYPSLNEAWKSLFPDSSVVPCPKWCFGKDYYPIFVCAEHDCNYCKSIPMHPELAEKLGIKPKEEK